MISYLDQLELKSRDTGISIAEACRLEGVASTTPWRWKTKKTTPREETVLRLLARMESVASGAAQ